MLRKLFEDFIDDLEQNDQLAQEEVDIDIDKITLELHQPTGKEKFMFKFKHQFAGIYHHWKGNDDECFYPLRTFYNRIWKIIDRSNFFINPTLSLPFVSDESTKCTGTSKKILKEFRVDEEMFSDDSIDVNKLYGFNELSYHTDFTYDICFDEIVSCKFETFIRRFENILSSIRKATSTFVEDKGEFDFYDMRFDEPKKINSSSFYTSLCTLNLESYVKVYSTLFPDKAPEISHDDNWSSAQLRRQRSNLDFELMVKNGLKRCAEDDLKPEIKLIDTVDKPYFNYFGADKGKTVLSFAMIDMKFPEKEVDLAQIDYMIATKMIPVFPRQYFSAIEPVFIIRCPNKLVAEDRKKAMLGTYRRKSSGLGEYAYYDEDHKSKWHDREERVHKIEVKEGGFYSDGKHKFDWRTRFGNTSEGKKWIVILADKNGNIGKTPYSNKNFQYPSENEINSQLRLFIDRSIDIWDFSYNLSTSEWY